MTARCDISRACPYRILHQPCAEPLCQRHCAGKSRGKDSMRYPARSSGDPRSRRQFLRNGAGAILLAAGGAFAQARFPVRPVRIIVPFPPGQAADTAARMLAQKLTAIWGQQVVVDNRGGGLGIPAMVAAKSAAADGY